MAAAKKNTTTGLGFRAPFFDALIAGHEQVQWLEVITENYLWDRGARRQTLLELRKNYELSFHGVSLSLAAPEALDPTYLRELKEFADVFQPARISDHLCWSSLGGHHWHDLLPFPYTEENLTLITQKVLAWQDALKRPLILENLSAYVQAPESAMSEYAFLAELVKRTDCQILLDVNNMIVNAMNFGIDPVRELDRLDMASVAQVHLAGFTEGKDFVIDTHSTPPNEATWELWSEVCRRRSDIPFMIEWDADIPNFDVVAPLLERARSFQESA